MKFIDLKDKKMTSVSAADYSNRQVYNMTFRWEASEEVDVVDEDGNQVKKVETKPGETNYNPTETIDINN